MTSCPYYDLFISYGRADSKSFVINLSERLKASGLKVWVDINDIPFGVDYQQQINEDIEKSHVFLFVISPHSVNSPYCGLEIDYALKLNKRIITVLHVEAISKDIWQQRYPCASDADWGDYQAKGLHSSFSNLSKFLRKINWINFREGIDDLTAAFKDLLEVIERHQDYVHQHTHWLVKALEWDRRQRQTRDLLVDRERKQAQKWLKFRFVDEQPPCTPTDLQCEFITESIKNAHNLTSQVFVGYHASQKALAFQIRRYLIREAVTVWMPDQDVHTGENLVSALNKGIEGADNYVFLMSSAALKSDTCRDMIAHAHSLHKRIIPIQTEEPLAVDLLPETINELQPINLVGVELIEVMDQLMQVLWKDAAYHQQHKLLLIQAIKWKRQHYNPSILLRGHNLRHAQTWLQLAKKRTQQQPNLLQCQFIEESARQPPLPSLDVFISYSRADSDFARRINNALQVQGKTTWFDQESIAAGVDFEQEILRGIESADNFLFILSPEAVSSKYCDKEVGYAAQLNKRFVTLLHHSLSAEEITLPEPLAKIQWINFRSRQTDFTEQFNQLVRTLDTDRDHVRGHTKWSQQALDWQEHDQNEDLLLRGSELEIASSWLSEAEMSDKQPSPTELQRKFIQTSRSLHERLIHEQEAQRQKELKRARSTTAGTLVALACMTGLALFARIQWIQAERGKIIAQTRSAEALYASENTFDSLIEALRAGINLKQSFYARQNDQIRSDVLRNLQQGIFWVREQNTFSAHEETVWAVEFSPDGTLIATAGWDKKAVLWDSQGNLLVELEGHTDRVNGISFSPDGQQIVTGSSDRTLKIWNQQGQLLKTLEGHADVIWGVDFSPDGTLIASASQDSAAILWGANGEQVATLAGKNGHTSELRDVRFSPDSQFVVTVGMDQAIKLWDRDGNFVRDIGFHEAGIWSVAFGPDGSTLVTAGEDKRVRLWSVNGEALETFVGEDKFLGVAFSPDGRYISAVGYELIVRVWNREGNIVHEFNTFYGGGGLAFSPDSNKLITGSFFGSEAKLWHLQDTGLHILAGHTDWVFGARFSPDGELIASGSRDNTGRIWSVDGQLLHVLSGHASAIWNIEFSSNGQFIGTASNDGTAKLWTREGELLTTIDEHEASVIDIAFSPDGEVIATSSKDWTVKLWDFDQQAVTLQNTLEGHSNEVSNVTFSPDSEIIATGSFDQTIKLWNRSGELLDSFVAHEGIIFDLQFSPDGTYLISTSQDKTAKVWRVEDSKLVATLEGHEGIVYAGAYNPDTNWIATSSHDKTIKLWSPDGKLLHTLSGLGGYAQDVSFHPTELLLLSASNTGEVILWDLNYVEGLDPLLERGCNWARHYISSHLTTEQQLWQFCSRLWKE
jgi:WD40 repeat protein